MHVPVPSKKSYRILIVDDETLVCWSLSRALQEEGYEVFTVETAEEALHLLKKNGFSLVITDLRLPRITGMDLVRQVKKFYPQCKVLMISAFGTPQTRDEALKEGALKFIDKPFDIRDIKESVNTALLE